ncbi:expressed unknown protein [Seminavis robusta]|uniref:Uncharacterized protein n=1 Tax=Seminavis robusta TaxID=568900 RepID=A0A9N8HM96_9STRA|nr:expressed unknown protein [Seminavis robusta]|eukprot:Sro729_g193850.1 n/a (271) ;mRNA; f:29194-30006
MSSTANANATATATSKPPPLSHETIQKRLLTGCSSKGGARGSLTRCAAKLGALHAKLSAQGGSTDQEILTVKDDLKREIRLFQVEMRKMIVMIQSAETELSHVQEQYGVCTTLVTRKQTELQQLRQQATKVARTRSCWQEYETLAKLARQRSPRRVLKAKLEKSNADLQKTKKQLYETAAESKVREKQFHLLIQCMLDLKRSLGETVEIPPPPKEEETAKKEEPTKQEDAKKEEEEEATPKKNEEATKKAGSDTQPMQVEEEDDLYGGLP